MGISFKIDSQHLGNFSIGIINIGLNIEIQYTIFYNFEKLPDSDNIFDMLFWILHTPRIQKD